MLVWCSIAPHGGEVIAEIAGADLPRMQVTRAAMEELGRRCQAERPDTIVVFTPHGVQLDNVISISAAAIAEGSLEGSDGSSVSIGMNVDGGLVEAILLESSARAPAVVPIAFADADKPMPFQLDWGAVVPLWFMGARWNPQPEIVVLCPSRALSRNELVDFGRTVATACALSERRIAIICSADQGHGHDKAGPYGFADESAEYDAAYVKAIEDDALDRLLDWDEEWIRCALVDSYWQTLMLCGALQDAKMRAELISYEAPTYFGMACAAFQRQPNR